MKSMEKKKVIIWDFDGPIVDSREIALELTQYEYHGIDEHNHRDLFNKNIYEELSKLKRKSISDEELTAFLEKSYWPRKLKLTPVQGIGEVLSALSKNFSMVINSSSPEPQIVRYLTKYNFLSFFQKIYGKEIKSKEEKFKLILRDFNVAAADCILITDTIGDVLEAESLNIPSIIVLWGYQLKKHFDSLDEKVTFVEHASEITKAVESHFSKI